MKKSFYSYSGAVCAGLILLLWAPGSLLAQTADNAKDSSMVNVVNPGETWHDTQGNVIQAHAPGIIKVKSTWYWFGEDKTDGSPFQNVRCYSSNDLINWEFRTDALTRQDSGDLGPNRIIERPKVLYNRSTKTYVMYVHVDDHSYREAKVGVATSKSPDGPYSYIGSFSPLGHQSRDMTIWQDDDGTGYLIFEDRQRGVCIALLSSDYLTVVKEVALIPHSYEAPAVVKVAGVYYLLGSHLSGWSTNPNQYTTAPSMAGPWSDYKDVAPGSPNTYDSQTAFILQVGGKKTTSYIYMGDRWRPNNLSDSRYMWMPLQVGDGVMSLPAPTPWTIDVKSGTITTIPQ